MTRHRSPPGSRAQHAIALVGLLVAAGVPALSTASSPAEPDPALERWNTSTHVNARIVDNYALVEVTTTIENPGPAREFPFRVQVPDDAFISGLAIERGGEVYEGHVEKRQEARQTYTQARAEGHTAGIVEDERDSSLYTYRVNVGSGDTVNATLTYETYLTAAQGVYAIDLTGPDLEHARDEGTRFTVEVVHSGGLDRVWGHPTAKVSRTEDGLMLEHREGSEDDELANFTARYTLEETPRWGEVVSTVHNGTGYFAHRFRAAPSSDQLPLDLALVLDTSGSMSGLKIDQLRRAARGVVDELDTDDRLHLTLFDGRVQAPWTGLEPMDEDRSAQADDVIESLSADGSTNIGEAIRDGFGGFENASSESERMPALAFLTDGKATDGVTDTGQLRQMAREANGADAHVFSLAFGRDADWRFVHGLAKDGDGTAVRVSSGEGASADIERFLTALTTPVLKQVRIDYAGDVDPLNATAPALFAGSEMLVVGTFDPSIDRLDATVHAQAADGSQSWNVSEPVGDPGPNYVPRLVAYHQIQALEARQDAYGHNETREQRIEELSLEHGFVTSETSLVLDLPPIEADQSTSGPETNASQNTTGPSVNASSNLTVAPSTSADRDAADVHSTSGSGAADAASAPSQPSDADGDGLADDADNCPDTANPSQADRDRDGVGEACDDSDDRPDADGDGIGDANDACPQQAGSGPADGCPPSPSGSSDGAVGQEPAQETETDDQQEAPGLATVAILLVIAGAAIAIARWD